LKNFQSSLDVNETNLKKNFSRNEDTKLYFGTQLSTKVETQLKIYKLNFDTDRLLKIFFDVDDVSVFAEQALFLGVSESTTKDVYFPNEVMRSLLLDN
jgi:hypothetical protein